MGKHQNLTGAQRVARRRAALRAQGLRPKQFWLPDLRDPAILADIKADAASLAAQRDRWLSDEAFAIALGQEMIDSLPPYDWGEGGPPGVS